MGNVVRLFIVSHQHRAAFVVDAVFGVVVADALDGIAGDLDVIDVGIGGNFTRQNDQTGIGQRFGGDAGFGVLLENCIQNRVRNLVGNFVGVAFGNGFGGEKKIVRHD